MEQGVTQHVTLDVVRSGKFVQWATAEQRRELRQMHFKAVWYNVIGHATKPPLRSGDFAMSRADFERINGFDENFRGWGCEDDDFGRRLRAAGVRLVSILNRTYLYHLWHPPAPTRPDQWKKGANVAYLQRPLRLTRCLNGMAKRPGHDLTVRLVDEVVAGSQLHTLLKAHGWIIETSRKIKTDLELRCIPGRGHFTARTDCRVLAVFEESLFDRIDAHSAHIVLSPSGQIGRRHQMRLRLDDVDGFWAVLHGVGALQQRAAA
jgi:GT2 family glycosyltransferase